MTRTLVAFALLYSSTASAMDYGTYAANLSTDPGRATVRSWLDGFGSAIGMYDSYQVMDGRTARFCRPRGLKFSPELLAGLVDKVVNQQPQLAKRDTPVEAIIWVGLENAFPCPKGKVS